VVEHLPTLHAPGLGIHPTNAKKKKKQTKNKPSVLKDETVMKKHNKTLAKQTS
jgi:hypothetical protein